MAKSRKHEQVRLAGVWRRPRRALMVTTALQATVALVLALPARAQLAANAQPTGGVVVAGSASISQTPNATNIDQSSQRAALNWQSFNVGANQSVNFHQPNANAVALNRVVGPDPSQIAGRINANGQVILENQDGITFSKGAQVNTAGFVATTSGITNKNFMAGHMVFDRPGKPGARIVNEGHITVREAGIAALVAPQVANSGVITAELGRVVLAGATRYTLDLYGDGLVSIDVTGSVKQVPVGPNGATATALVTNSGTILAAGGRIELTARAAAGLVQELVAAGGKIAAPTAGAQTGQVVLNGIGGSIVIAGQLDATGAGAGQHGGAIQVSPAGGVVLASTARVDASGQAGGGTVAIGTDLKRAAGGPTVTPTVVSHDVTVARGAVIAANATGRGNGGRITVLSSDSTVMDGAISARGGAAGGNGGFVEVSGRTLGFDGQVDVGAPQGALGTVLFDPGTLTIQGTAGNLDATLTSTGTILYNTGTTFLPDTISSDTVSNAAIQGVSGNILLQATTLLSVQAPITLTTPNQGLTLQSGGNLEVLAGDSITTAGNISLSAATAGITGANTTGSITLGANITTTSGVLSLSAGTGGIALGGATLSAPTVDLTSTFAGPGGVSQSAGGAIIAGVLTSSGNIAGGATLTGANTIAALGNFIVTNGDLTLADTGSLSVTGLVQATDVALTAGTLGVAGEITATGAGGTIALTGTAGALGLTGAGAVLNGPTITLNAGTSAVNIGSLTTVNAGTLLALGGAGVNENAAAAVAAPTLVSIGTIGGAVDLAGTQNAIGTVGGFTVAAGNAFTLTDRSSQLLTLAGSLVADSIDANAGTIAVTGPVGDAVNGSSITLAAGGGGISFGPSAVVNAGNLHVLDLSAAGNGVTAMAGAKITAAVLQSSGGVHGGLALPAGTDIIGQLGSFVVTGGDFALIDAPGQTLDLAGSVSAAGATLTLGSDVLKFDPGSSLVAATVALASVTPGSTVTLGTNASAHFALINAGRIDVGRLDSSGSITAGAISITASVSVPATTTLGLYSTGTIVESGTGSLIAGGLGGEADGGAMLGGANTIGATAGFIAAGQTFDLANDASQVSLGGSIGVGTFILTDSTGTVTIPGTIVANHITIDPTSIDVAGTMSSPTLIALDALTGGITLESTSALLTPAGSVELTTTGGGVTQVAGGVISAGTLFSAGDVAGTVGLVGSNTIASIGSFTVTGGDFVLADGGETGALSLPATLIANNVTIGAASGTPGTIDLDGGTIGLNGGSLVALNAGAGGITLGTAALVNAGTAGTLAVSTTGGGVSEAAGATIIAGTLLSAPSVGATADLVGSNTLATLGGFTVNGGDFTLISTGSLTATGPVRATNVSISTGTLDVGGAITAGAASGNTLALTTNGGTLGLDNGAILSGATIALNGNGAAVNIGSIAVVDAATLLELGGAGVNEGAGGTIIAGTLVGLNTITAGVTLLGSNTIATLGGVALSAGNFLLADGGESAGTLTVVSTLLAPNVAGATIALGTAGGLPGAIDVISTGTVDVGLSHGGLAVLDAGTLGIAMTGNAFVGGFNLNTVDLSAGGGGISEQPTARIGASYLQSSGGVTGTVDLAGTLNALPQINGFVVTNGNLIVVDQPNQALTVAGSVSAAGGTIDVTADGLFLPNSGSLVANRVAVMPSSAAGNPMTVLGVEPGSLLLGTFVVNGQIAAGQIDLGSLDSGASVPGATAISIADGISMPAATLGLYAQGGITEAPAGSLSATALTGQAGGPVSLGNANSIGTLGGFAVNGAGNGLILNDTAALTVAGAVTAPGQVFLQDSNAGGVTLAATGALAGATLDSVQTDAFTLLSGGTITGATFELAPNTTGSLVTLGGSGGLSLASLAGIGPSTVRIGAVTSPTAGTLVTTAGSIAVGGAFGASGTNLDLHSNGGIGQTAPLTAGTLSGNAFGTIALGLTTNNVSTLGTLSAASFTLGDGTPLTVNGPVNGGALAAITDTALLSVPGTISATAISLTGTSLAIGGLVTDGGAGTTTLVATGGSITEGGTLIVGTLSGSSTGGATSLTGATVATNQIGTLAGFSASGFTLDDGTALTVNGPVAGGPSATILDSALLSVPGSVNATAISLTGANLTIGGTVSDGGAGTTTLVATGGSIIEGGTLIVGTLSGSSTGGATSLTGATVATNQIGTLAGFSASGFTLDDGTALTVNGPVTGGASATILDSALLSVPGSVNATAINLTGATLTIGGTVSDGGAGTTTLVATGGSIIEGGTLIVGTLSGSSTGGATSLTGATVATNQIGTLAGFSASGFTLDDGTALTVNGPVTGGPSATILDSALLSVPGSVNATAISLTGTSLAIGGLVTDGGAGTTTLVATGGSITEGGTLIVGTLSGSSTGGATSLTGATVATNQIGTLAGFSASGFTLDDGTALTVNGPVTGGPSASILDSALLSVPGSVNATAISLTGTNLAIGGTVSDGGAGTTTLVATGGSIIEGGTLIVGTLSGSSTAATSLTGASATTNQIGTLADFSAGGFTLNDGTALTVNGPVTGGASATILDSALLSVPGSVNATAISLTGANLAIGGTVSDGGAGTTTLVATGGSIIEGGVLIVGTLTGHSVGATQLNWPSTAGNQIARLSNFSATELDINDGAPLTLSGTIAAPLIQIDAGSNSLTIAGGTTLVTGGMARPPGTFGSSFLDPGINPGAQGGAYLSDFTQQGAVTVVSPTGGDSILEITANRGGNIAFDPNGSPNGLTGPNTWLILKVPGATSGSITGNVYVKWLDVIFDPGSSGGGANLFGTINGIGGQPAAGEGKIVPQPDARFRFNTCAIGSVNCIVLPVEVLPLTNPLEEFSLGSLMNPFNEDELFLPIVSDRDY